MQSGYKRKQRSDWWLYLTVVEKMGSWGATDLQWAACWWQMSGDQDVPHAEGPRKRRWPQQTDERSIMCEQRVAKLWPVRGLIFETLYPCITLHFCLTQQTAGRPHIRQHPLLFTAVFSFQKLCNLLKFTRRVVERWNIPSHLTILRVCMCVFTAFSFTMWVMVS